MLKKIHRSLMRDAFTRWRDSGYTDRQAHADYLHWYGSLLARGV